MQISKSAWKKLVAKKDELMQELPEEYLKDEEGTRLSHWREGCDSGKNIGFNDALKILGIYDEAVKAVAKERSRKRLIQENLKSDIEHMKSLKLDG